MQAFGDESGRLDNLLHGECDHYVLGVVAGDIHACRGCAKRAVDDVTGLPEAKWNELTGVQKRRFVDCLSRRQSDLRFGYIAFERSDLRRLEHRYLLYQDAIPGIRWNLFLMGVCYAAILNRTFDDPTALSFTFDRIYAKKQSDDVADVIGTRTQAASVSHAGSRTEKGIQTADCFAGAVAESRFGDTEFLEALEHSRVTPATTDARVRIEKALHDVKTGP